LRGLLLLVERGRIFGWVFREIFDGIGGGENALKVVKDRFPIGKSDGGDTES
jgi:hypothetical protein